MKEIKLSKGKVAFVDDEDYERLNQFKWYAVKGGRTFYAQRNIKLTTRMSCMLMHRMILEPKDKYHTDHKNGNGLDNRKENLRYASEAQNQWNSQKRIGNSTSRFKGVEWNKKQQKWRANIRVNRIKKYLGCFADETDAAKAYDNKAKELFGEYAKLNS
jgi:hypothetical protein